MSGSNALSVLPSMWLLLMTLGLVSFTSLLYIAKHRDQHSTQSGGKLSRSSRSASASSSIASANANTKLLFQDLQSYVKVLEGVVKNLNSSSDGNSALITQQTESTFIPQHGQEGDTMIPAGGSPHPQLRQQTGEIAEAASIGTSSNDLETKAWLEQLSRKLRCLRLHVGGVYLYHTRKAAGTTIRDIVAQVAAQQWKVPYFETEGIVMPESVLDVPGLLTITSLREPVTRVLSLYWYEHVGWYDGVLQQCKKRCKTLNEWVAGWRDDSQWKRDFMKKNPGSVYVEIENYYVKMLSGWTGRRTHRTGEGGTTGGAAGGVEEVTEWHLEKAKAALRKFDLVLLSDWMADETQLDAMNIVFPGRSNVAAGHKVQGDFSAKVRLRPTLAPDEDAIRKGLLRDINKWDLKLWEYAQSLMAYRLKLIAPAVNTAVKAELGLDAHRNTVSISAAHSNDQKQQQQKQQLRQAGSAAGSESGGRVVGNGYTSIATNIRKYADQCRADKRTMDSVLSPNKELHHALGIFQPPKHKGPF